MSPLDRHGKINRPLKLARRSMGLTVFLEVLFLSPGNNLACIVTRRQCDIVIVPFVNLKSMV